MCNVQNGGGEFIHFSKSRESEIKLHSEQEVLLLLSEVKAGILLDNYYWWFVMKAEF